VCVCVFLAFACISLICLCRPGIILISMCGMYFRIQFWSGDLSLPHTRIHLHTHRPSLICILCVAATWPHLYPTPQPPYLPLPFLSFPFGTHFVRCIRFVVVIKGVNAVDNYTRHPLGPRTLLSPSLSLSLWPLLPLHYQHSWTFRPGQNYRVDHKFVALVGYILYP